MAVVHTNFDLNTLLRENVKALQAYSSARDEFTDFTKEMVFLDANENPFNSGVNRYPDPQQKNVKNILADLKKVSPDQIVLGNGSDEILDLLFRAFCNPKQDKIISLPPTYGMYGVLAGINDVENTTIALTPDFQPDVDTILKQATDAHKILFLCSPNNPTANSFDAAKIETLLLRFKGIVVIDEAYIDFSPTQSWICKLQNHPNLVVTQTLSKAVGMAGIRLGACYASKEIVAVLQKIKPPYNVNVLTQERAAARLSNYALVNQEIQDILAQRAILAEAIDTLPFVKKQYPSEANFILLEVDDATKRYQQLLEKGIVVRNRTTQLHCKNCIRITVGTAQENKTLITALKALV